jgi:hypothetical protein
MMYKEIYQQPKAERIELAHPLSILVDLSADATIGEWGDIGEED